MINQDITFKGTDNLVLGDGVQTDSVKPTAATAYKRGDLLKIDPVTNVATHATVADWSVVALEDVTATQADKALATGFEIPVYTQGELNVNAVSLKGVLLTDEQKTTARGRANANGSKIELRKPFVAK